ncbi:MAG TPA: hypothetical protein VHD90_26590 [Phototrophicaceae bacterium]|nr:hypothetical protein [Phototrophicaceae bacterium]
MRLLRATTEADMVAVFLKAEIGSERYGASVLDALQKHTAERHIIDTPNLSDEAENQLRRAVLDEYRGYLKRNELFGDFPTDVQWRRVLLDKADLRRAKYIVYDYWVELSGGSRLAADAATHIRNGMLVFGTMSTAEHLERAEQLRQSKRAPEMIFVSTGDGGDLVVLEGHNRLTAYLLALDDIPDEVEALIGYSPNIVHWDGY